MRLIEMLESLGDRLGLLEKAVGNASPAGLKIQTRSVTLEELKSEIRSEEVQALADLPAELAVPFDKIMETADKLRNDLIVIGTHGWRGVNKALIGSTAERIIAHASSPILVVK